MVDVNPRLKACGGIYVWKAECRSHSAYRYRRPNLGLICIVLRVGVRCRFNFSHQPAANPKSCPPPTAFFTGRQDILVKMREYFLNDLGNQHVFVLCGLAVPGRAKLHSKFIDACQAETRSSYSPKLPIRMDLCSCQGSRMSSTLTLPLGDHHRRPYPDALAKGLGESRKHT